MLAWTVCINVFRIILAILPLLIGIILVHSSVKLNQFVNRAPILRRIFYVPIGLIAMVYLINIYWFMNTSWGGPASGNEVGDTCNYRYPNFMKFLNVLFGIQKYHVLIWTVCIFSLLIILSANQKMKNDPNMNKAGSHVRQPWLANETDRNMMDLASLRGSVLDKNNIEASPMRKIESADK
jgi:hypothetical protein